MDKKNLLGLSRSQLRSFFAELGEKPFRADQVLQWIHQYGVSDFQAMSNLSKKLRATLEETCIVQAPDCVSYHEASDGTTKWLLKVAGGSAIEMVLIPERHRRTLCVSSQVGCLLDCRFCCTGKQGFARNLSSHEIIGQVWRINAELRALGKPLVTNVVMMGMGEPLLNYEAVIPALQLMREDFAYGLSKRRVTLSTSGIVPRIRELATDCDVALAISLHAPTNALRDVLVPINKKYPLEALIEACQAYLEMTNHRAITMEYVMLKDVNDSPEHARALLKVLKGLSSKVNLIPFNPFKGTDYERSTPEVIDAFRDILLQGRVMTTIRRTRGDDISAACGQLAGSVQDKTYRALRFQEKIQSQREAS